MTVEVIAEIGSNWQGDLKVLGHLSEAAAQAGADTVKVQHYMPELGPHPFTPTLLAGAKGVVESHGLKFLASVFDLRTLQEYRDACQPTRVKIASPELTHDHLLRELGGLEVLLSTGASGWRLVEHAMEVVPTPLTLLHCVSAYPAPPEEMNVSVISDLLEISGCPVGLSDHTLDPATAPVMAVALGATVIEKHMTLDRTLDGPDQSYALEPDEFAFMVEKVRLAAIMVGDGEKRPMPSEDVSARR